jgi:transposase InsO family protein
MALRKVWHQLRREGVAVAKCTVERLMRIMGLAGVRRGKRTITTVSNPKAPCPLDKVNREFRVARPNALWVVDFTYVHTWAGFVYVAFVIDAYARRIVGWKVSTSATAGFVLDALEQAIHARRPGPDDGLVHHSDRGVQYLAMAYTQRLAEANLVPSVGSVGDSYDNALAETINGLYKAEVIWRQRSWPNASAVEMATLRWVDWYNNQRLFGASPLLSRPDRPSQFLFKPIENLDMAAFTNETASGGAHGATVPSLIEATILTMSSQSASIAAVLMVRPIRFSMPLYVDGAAIEPSLRSPISRSRGAKRNPSRWQSAKT